MCMEDIRLGRRTNHLHRLFAVTTGSKVLFDRDKLRTQLMVYPPVSGTLTLDASDSVTANAGITMTASSHPLLMTVETHGDLVTNRFSVIHSAGGISIFVSEGRLLDT